MQPFHLMTLPPSLQETQERLYAEIKPSVEVEIECNIELHTRVCNVSSRKVCFGKNIRNLASDLLTCSQLERCFLKKPFQELGTWPAHGMPNCMVPGCCHVDERVLGSHLPRVLLVQQRVLQQTAPRPCSGSAVLRWVQ